jgi:hypothetical protein
MLRYDFCEASDLDTRPLLTGNTSAKHYGTSDCGWMVGSLFKDTFSVTGHNVDDRMISE